MWCGCTRPQASKKTCFFIKWFICLCQHKCFCNCTGIMFSFLENWVLKIVLWWNCISHLFSMRLPCGPAAAVVAAVGIKNPSAGFFYNLFLFGLNMRDFSLKLRLFQLFGQCSPHHAAACSHVFWSSDINMKTINCTTQRHTWWLETTANTTDYTTQHNWCCYVNYVFNSVGFQCIEHLWGGAIHTVKSQSAVILHISTHACAFLSNQNVGQN